MLFSSQQLLCFKYTTKQVNTKLSFLSQSQKPLSWLLSDLEFVISLGGCKVSVSVLLSLSNLHLLMIGTYWPACLQWDYCD